MIGIVGAGALGHMLGFFLKRERPDMPLLFIGREGPIATHALMEWQGHHYPLQVDKPLRESSCQILFLLVKSYQLEEALATSLPKLKAGGVLVILGNGYLEPLLAPWRARYPRVQWRKGIVTWGVRKSAGEPYVISRRGEMIWGGPEGPAEIETKICAALSAYGVAWSEESCRLRRRKWFCNTALNTICGVYRLPSNGLALSLFAQDLEALAREVMALGQEMWPDWQENWDSLWETLRALILATEGNENSMARDIRLGQKTEAEVLSGCIRLASKPGRYPLLATMHARLAH